MWASFFICAIVATCLLYVPGALLLRAARRPLVACVAAAPLVSVSAYALLAIAYGAVGIPASAVTLLAPVLVVAVASFAVSVHRGGLRVGGEDPARSRQLLYLLVLYMLVGLVICFKFFVEPLDGAASFEWNYDVTKHLNQIWQFACTDNWSMLRTTLYDNALVSEFPRAYYPAAWHIVPAMCVQLVDAQPAVAMNAMNAAVIGLIIPGTFFYLLQHVMRRPLVLVLCSPLPLAFGVYPWRMVSGAALYPIVLGLAFLPVAIAVFDRLCARVASGERPAGDVALLAGALLACALCHPITVFTAGVICLFVLLGHVVRARRAAGDATRTIALRVTVILAVCACVWVLLYLSPALKGVTAYINESYTDFASQYQAFSDVAFLSFAVVPAHFVLAPLVWLGIAYTCWRHEYLWATCGFLAFGAMYYIVATRTGTITHLVAGFWYSDPDRLAASAAICGVVLAALGVHALSRLATAAIRACRLEHLLAGGYRDGVIIACVVIFCTCNFFCNFKFRHEPEMTPTTFGYLYSTAKEHNKLEESVLDDEERDFLDEVKLIVGDDLVLNLPMDGSAFAYATDDINVYFRRYSFTEDETNELIVTSLCDIEEDADVRKLVDKLDARYVLLLDCTLDETDGVSSFYVGFDAEDWTGFAIRPRQTEGFELVLAEGDMRLYRICD